MIAGSFVVEHDDPCLDGHFPGNPVVPGVVILDAVVNAARSQYGIDIAGIARCKFLLALAPGQRCRIELEAPDDDGLRFTCTSADGDLVRGRLTPAACRDDR